MAITRRAVVQGLAASGLTLGLSAQAAQRGTRADARHAFIGPASISSITGRVQDAQGLVGGGRTTLHAEAGIPATVVLDYGRLVGGLPVFDIASVSERPILTAIYSQALPWLWPHGDGPAPGKPATQATTLKEISFVGFAGGADLSRVEQIPLQRGRRVNRLIQGGQRFQALQLSGVGAVTLARVGFVPTFRQHGGRADPGSFSCSDPQLSEIWALGAYALDVASVPAGAVPAVWDISAEGATVYGDTYSGYQRGLNWTDYTARFEVRIEANEAAWLVRAQPPDGIRLVLCSASDRLPISTPNTLRIYTQFRQTPIATVPLPMPVHAGDWHRVETVVRGSMLTVSLDGMGLGSWRFPTEGGFWGSTAVGWLALANASGAIATVRNLHVMAADGTTLLRMALNDPAVLDEFAAGQSTRSTVLDGATRDRLLFSGDLGVAARTLVYSSFDLAYLKDSIGLFAEYQSVDGAIPTSIPPQANPGRTPGDAFKPGITDYTVQHVTTIHTYWMHTADVRFLRAQWPTIRRVLRYLNDHTDSSTGLFAPAARSGGPRIAETLTNAHYYGALRQCARMADALGEAAEAAALAQAATQLRQAINRQLFNHEAGLYAASDRDRESIGQHENAYAVLYGVAEEAQVPHILEHLAATLHRPGGPLRSTAADGRIVSPYTSGYEVLARLQAGDAMTALNIIRRAWHPMCQGSAYYSGATWEYVGLDARPGLGSGTSLAHPWSSAPTSALCAYVLGVRPLTPGFDTWLVEPQPGDLSWAKGSVPTPHGAIAARWVLRDAGLVLRLQVPAGTVGYAGVPVNASGARIEVDGRVAIPAPVPPSGASRRGYVYIGPLAAGEHLISVSGE